MDSFVTRKRKRSSDLSQAFDEGRLTPAQPERITPVEQPTGDDDSTELKIAILSSLFPDRDQDALFECLLASDGSVEVATRTLKQVKSQVSPRKPSSIGYQSSLAAYAGHKVGPTKSLTKKGQTLHLYAPEDIEKHTPCSIIHNFLSSSDAERLLNELIVEVPQFQRHTFQMFERTVSSPHTYGFYVDSLDEAQDQQDKYVYNGGLIPNVFQSTPEMLRASIHVREAVNTEIARRIQEFNPDKKKLKFQSPDEWRPNTSFINCYDGGKESVGYHSDQLTYLGPRAVIGSLSLGVAREFRVRKIVPQDDVTAPDAQGQIAIHLPHNSLLVMHAEMQEEWKHAIAPAAAIDPHPIAGNKRINITYRCYKDYLHPKYTPCCKCKVPCVLRCVQRQKVTRGRYMWMCHANYVEGQKGCSFFEWAAFDEDGRPPWAEGYKGNANIPIEASVPLDKVERTDG